MDVGLWRGGTAHHARATEPQAVRGLAVAPLAPAIWDSGRREWQVRIVAFLVAKLRARRSAPPSALW